MIHTHTKFRCYSFSLRYTIIHLPIHTKGFSVVFYIFFLPNCICPFIRRNCDGDDDDNEENCISLLLEFWQKKNERDNEAVMLSRDCLFYILGNFLKLCSWHPVWNDEHCLFAFNHHFPRHFPYLSFVQKVVINE